MSLYRYPGLRPFEEEETILFQGRTQDIESIIKLIKLEKLVVIYGKSGLGKSSLIKAGLMPQLSNIDGCQPFLIKFGHHQTQESDSLSDIFREQITIEERKSNSLFNFLDKYDSLWALFKQKQIIHPKEQVILIIDQAEELFTYPELSIQFFIRQLRDLLFTQIPQYVRNDLAKSFEQDYNFLSEDDKKLLFSPLNIRIVFSIRSDRLSLLHQISDSLPPILDNRYEVRKLSIDQAKEAINIPAQLVHTTISFKTPTFKYTEEAIDDLIRFLSQNFKEGIEAFQLQIVCQHIERSVETNHRLTISRDDLDDISSIYHNYYENQLTQIQNPNDRKVAIELLEEGLIYEEEEQRLRLLEGQIKEKYKVDPPLLEKLVQLRLLRPENHANGNITYEITHDTLIPPILAAKNQRKVKEELHAQRQKLVKTFAGIISGVALLGIIFYFLLTYQQAKRQNIALSILNYAQQYSNNDPNIALRIAEKAWLKDENPIIEHAIHNIYQNNIFYHSIIKLSGDARISASAISRSGVLGVILDRQKQGAIINFEKNTQITWNPPERVTVIRFSPNDSLIATASRDGIRIWNSDGSLLSLLEGHKSTANALYFSNDNRLLYSIGSRDKKLIIWDIETKSPIQTITYPETIYALTVLPDQQTIAVGDSKGNIYIQNVEGEVIANISTGHKRIWSLDYNPQSGQLLSTSGDGFIGLWDLSGNKVDEFIGHTGAVYEARFSPSGQYIISASQDNSSRIWEVETGTEIQKLKGHTDWVKNAGFSLDESKIYTISNDHSVREWRFDDRKIYTSPSFQAEIKEIIPTADTNKVYILTNDYKIHIGNLYEKQFKILELENSEIFPEYITYNEAKGLLALGDAQGHVYVMDTIGKLQHDYLIHSESITALSFDGEGKWLLSSSSDSTSQVWSLDDNQVIISHKHQSLVADVAWFPAGTQYATADGDSNVYIWDIYEEEAYMTFNGHAEAVFSVDVSPDGEYILSGSKDYTARLWDIDDQFAQIISHQLSVNRVAFSGDKKYGLSTSDDKTIKLIDISGNVLNTYPPTEKRISVAAFSNNGKYIYTGGTRLSILNVRPTLSEFLTLNYIDSLSKVESQILDQIMK